MRRRELLATTGTAATGSIAGCMIPFAEDGIRIGGIQIVADGPSTLRLEVERDGEEILGRWFEFDAETVEWIESTWDNDPATYTVRYVGVGFETPEGIVTDTLTHDSLDGDHSHGDLRGEDCIVLRIDADIDRSDMTYGLWPPELLDRECPDS